MAVRATASWERCPRDGKTRRTVLSGIAAGLLGELAGFVPDGAVFNKKASKLSVISYYSKLYFTV